VPDTPSQELHAEITQLETELERVLALASVLPAQRDALRERMRQLKLKAGLGGARSPGETEIL